MELHIHEYSLDEVKMLLSAAMDGDTNWAGRSSNDPAQEDFHGGFTLEDAGNALIYGWDANRAEMTEEVDRLIAELQEEVNDYLGQHHRDVRDVSGGYVDMDRFLMGDPECMVESWLDEDAVQGKAIKVLVNCSVSWMVDADRLIKRGSAIAAAVDAVLSSGMNVELWVGEAIKPSGWGGGGNEQLCELICVKEFNDLMDPDVLAYTVAHPTMLRRIMFFLNELHDEEVRREFGFGPDGSGYGRPVNWPDEVKASFDLVIERYETGDEDDPRKLYEKMMRMGDRASEYV